MQTRNVLPWNPRDVLELRMVDYPEKYVGPIPMGDFSNKSLALGQKTALNQGWIGSMIAVMAEFWDSLTGTFEERRDKYLARLFANQDELFHPALPAFTWRDMQIAAEKWYGHPVEKWDPQWLKTDWLNRSYHHSNSRFERIWWHHSGGFYCDGHGAYLNLLGSVAFAWSLFEELGGNAIQLVNREDEFKNGVPKIDNRMATGGTVEIQQFVIGNTGYSDGRGSFPISLMGLGRPGRRFDVEIEDGLILCRWPLPGSKGQQSRGGILVEGGLGGDWSYGDVSIFGVRIDLTKPDRQILAVNNAKDVDVNECEFIVRDDNAWVDIDRLDFAGFQGVKPCGYVEWRNNDGNVRVRCRGKDVGHVSEDMILENGKRVD